MVMPAKGQHSDIITGLIQIESEGPRPIRILKEIREGLMKELEGPLMGQFGGRDVNNRV